MGDDELLKLICLKKKKFDQFIQQNTKHAYKMLNLLYISFFSILDQADGYLENKCFQLDIPHFDMVKLCQGLCRNQGYHGFSYNPQSKRCCCLGENK